MNHSKSSLSFDDQVAFRVRDFRNGKFQGTLEQKTLRPHGPGMFLDANFTLSLSHWRRGRPNAQTILFDSPTSVLYGFIVNSVPTGLCCFQLSPIAHAFGCLVGNQVRFAVDCPQESTLITLSFTFSSWRDLIASLQHYDFSVQAWDSANNLQRKEQHRLLTAESSAAYRSEEQKWGKIEEFLGMGVDVHMKDYKQYMRVNFGQGRPDGTELNLVQTKQQFQLRHKMSSIVCKVSDREDKLNFFEVRLLGYFNAIDGEMEMQRKYHRAGSGIEEAFGTEEHVYDSQKSRPGICYRKARNYFQKSLTFTNDIVSVKELVHLSAMLRAVAEYASTQQTSNNAQALLQQPIRQESDNDLREARNNRKEQSLGYLQAVRRDVEQKAQRRSRRGHIRPEAQSGNFGYQAALYRNSPSPSRFQKQPSYIVNKESNLSQKHRFSYLEESEGGQTTFRSKSRHKNNHSRYNYVPSSPRHGLKYIKNLSPRHYEQEDYPPVTRSVYHQEDPALANLHKLTQDYARIEDQLKRQTSRNQTRFQQYPTPRKSRPQPSYYPSPRSGVTPKNGSVSPGGSRKQFQYVPPSPRATPSRRKWR